MASTIITTNTSALSRAANSIFEKREKLSMNSILNCMAAAIAGPGHDWGFPKNAPQGSYTQAGLEPPVSTKANATPVQDALDAPTSVWIVQYDEREDWARDPAAFATKEDALRFIEEDHAWWKHDDHPFEDVMEACRNGTGYIFSRDGDDEDYDDDQPYAINIHELKLTRKAPANRSEEQTASEPAPQLDVRKKSSILIATDCPYEREQGMTWDEVLFQDVTELETIAWEYGLDRKDPNWRESVYRGDDLKLTASFRPEAWRNNYAVEVDPEGDTSWEVHGDELLPDQSDLDYLKDCRNAPEWVKEWTGPFTITLDVEVPEGVKSNPRQWGEVHKSFLPIEHPDYVPGCEISGRCEVDEDDEKSGVKEAMCILCGGTRYRDHPYPGNWGTWTPDLDATQD